MGAVDGAWARVEDTGVRIAFVDESGDVGGIGSPTRHFVLVALVVEHASWAAVNAELCAMRERLLSRHGLRLDAEIHASEFLGGGQLHLGLGITERFQRIHHVLKSALALPGTSYVRACIDKSTCQGSPLDAAWQQLSREIGEDVEVPRPHACPARGLIVLCDHHAALPYRPTPDVTKALGNADSLLELPLGRDSKDSLPLQLADLLAYLTRQSIAPNGYFAKSGGRNLLRIADAIFAGNKPRA